MAMHLPQPARFPGPRWRARTARPCRCLSSQTGRLSLATPGFGTDVCKLTGGWESSDLHPGADQPPLPPLPLTPLPPGPTSQSQPPILPSHEPQGVGELLGASRSGLRTRGRRWGPPLTTPDFSFPRYCAIRSSAWGKPRLNGTPNGLNLGPLQVSGVPGGETAQGQDRFWEPARQAFPNPCIEATPRGTSALSCSQQSGLGHTQGLSRFL